MAFDINNFKSALNKHGGLARNNIFEVTLVGNPNNQIWNRPTFNNTDMKFFCRLVTLPGAQLHSFDHRPNNIDVAQAVPFAIAHQQLESVFMVDDKHRVANYLYSWMRMISNFSTGGIPGSAIALPGTEGSASEQFPYELGYKKDYSQTMIISKYAKVSNSPVTSDANGTLSQTRDQLVCKLYDVYPISVGGMTLSWAENDTISEIPVSFSYSSYEMSIIDNGVEIIGPGVPH